MFFYLEYNSQKIGDNMKKSGTYNRLLDFNIHDTIKFNFNNNETIYIDINPKVIDELCGLYLDHDKLLFNERKKLLSEKRDEIYADDILNRFSLVRGTNYFSSPRLLFVVFNPNVFDYYADFVFRTPDEIFISLRVSLTNNKNNYLDMKNTEVKPKDIFVIEDFEDLLCGKSFAYPIGASSKHNSNRYRNKFAKGVKHFIKNICSAYEVPKDGGKCVRTSKRFNTYGAKIKNI